MKKRKDGLYASQVYLGTENGRRKYKTVYGKTQKEVKEKVAELKLKLGKGIDIAAADEAFGIWVKRFLESKSSSGIGHAHYRSLCGLVNHLAPIYDTPIQRVSAADIQEIIDHLAAYHDGKAPLSKRTLTLIRQTAKQVFERAAALRVIEYNPATYASIPKNAKQAQREALTEEQQRWIVDTPHRAQRAAMLMLYSGLRRGEATALTWADIDFKNCEISVSKSVEFLSGKPRIKSTKSKAGVRTVSIPQALVDFLMAEKKNDECIYVLHMEDGGMLTENVWRQMWASYMCDLNIKYGHDGKISKFTPSKIPMCIQTFTPHHLRHTFASICYFAGVDVLIARDWLGHEDANTTLSIYTHLDKKHKRTGGKKLSEFIGRYDASEEIEDNA